MTLQELREQKEVKLTRMTELTNLCETENREPSAEEQREIDALKESVDSLTIQIRDQKMAEEKPMVQQSQRVDTDKVLRENLLEKNRKVTIELRREVTPQTTEALAETGIIPISEQEILKPIRVGLIWDKVGLSVRSGLIGTLRWPKHGKATAQWAGEAEKLVDAKIDFDKLNMNGHRLGIAIPVTREELENSVGVVENVIRTEAPAAVIDKINEALFLTEKGTHKVYGPFADKTQTSIAADRKGMRKLKTLVAKAIGTIGNGVYIMTEETKAILEEVPVDAGSGRFVCENDRILGYPVYVTDAIGENFIGFGDFSYQAAGWFGQTSFIADPYTLARQNSVDFVLNMHFGMVTLRPEAFALGKIGG